MRPGYTFLGLAFFAVPTMSLRAQPYHADTTVGGVQTLEVEGDLSVKQYGAGYGGDLKVAGDVRVATGGQVLPSLPSGVTGTYYGTLKLGSSVNIGEYVFEKTGDNITGDYIVPLGRIGNWEGTTIQLDVLTGPDDVLSGAAHYTLMSKRHRVHGDLTAVAHTAFGGGKGIKLYGENVHGVTVLFLEFDSEGGHNALRRTIIRVTTLGDIDPLNRESPFSASTPVRSMDMLVSDDIFGDEMTHTLNAGNLVLNGDVSISAGKSLTIGDSPVATEVYATSAATTAINDRFDSAVAISGGGAEGDNATAISGGLATGDMSTAISNGYAQGFLSVAMAGGFASGGGSTAMSYGSAEGSDSVAMSWGYALGDSSFAMAGNAVGYSSIALRGTANGSFSAAIGQSSQADSLNSVAIGPGSNTPGNSNFWVETDSVFAVGNSANGFSNAITTLKNGQTTLTNKDWKLDQQSDPSSVLNDPLSTTDSGGNALVIEGHAVMKGKVTVEVPQGDISMGIYQ